MAIAYDTFTSNPTGSGTTQTTSHTCSGSDRFLFVSVRSERVVNSATYAGVSMTIIAAANDGTGNHAAFLYLKNPASGANDIVVTFGSSSAYCGTEASSLNGCDTTTNPEASNSSMGVTVGTSANISVTTLTANAWVIGAAIEQGAGVTSAGSNTTAVAGGNNAHKHYTSNSNPVNVPGSVTLNFSSTAGTSDWSMGIVAIKPASSGVNNDALLLLGVG